MTSAPIISAFVALLPPPPFVGIIFSIQILKTGSTQFCKQFIFWNILFEKQSAHKSQFINLPDVVVP